ncbi:YraN family protein [Porphyromonas sp. COT-108 OH1349]|uniref:YraN family protein n=1 Tax=Porphyromonas sp. COT-108 OH1349 TaxID=1537504 RepID=UPI00068D5C1A|nr:YraN family protein [Porphyromonas sp. COT-108 OH1349]
MARHNQYGSIGEKYAIDTLTDIGFNILDTNVKIGRYEIDIIAMEGDVLVFIEVKSRNSLPSALGIEEIIPPGKQRHILSAVDLYLHSSTIEYRDVRIDYFFVCDNDIKALEYLHVRNALMPFV